MLAIRVAATSVFSVMCGPPWLGVVSRSWSCVWSVHRTLIGKSGHAGVRRRDSRTDLEGRDVTMRPFCYTARAGNVEPLAVLGPKDRMLVERDGLVRRACGKTLRPQSGNHVVT